MQILLALGDGRESVRWTADDGGFVAILLCDTHTLLCVLLPMTGQASAAGDG